MINLELYEQIVNKLVSVIEKDVNIIGLDGIIVASSDKKRINEYHEGGRICASSNRNVIITPKNLNLFRGCKSGVNLPIHHRNKIIAVIGITGEEENLLSYGNIVKQLVEVMISENEYREIGGDKSKKICQLFTELIHGINENEVRKYLYRMNLLDLQYNSKTKIIVGKIYLNEKNLKDKFNRFEDEFDRNILINNQIIYFKYEENFVIISNDDNQMKGTLNNIKKSFVKKGISRYTFIIGNISEDIRSFSREYEKISRVLELNKANLYGHIGYLSDYNIDLLVEATNKKMKEDYLSEYKYIFEDSSKKNNEILYTVKKYFENNMKITETAADMFIHKNTVLYRINKFKEKYHIEINNPYDCAKLYIAILARKSLEID